MFNYGKYLFFAQFNCEKFCRVLPCERARVVTLKRPGWRLTLINVQFELLFFRLSVRIEITELSTLVQGEINSILALDFVLIREIIVGRVRVCVIHFVPFIVIIMVPCLV